MIISSPWCFLIVPFMSVVYHLELYFMVLSIKHSNVIWCKFSLIHAACWHLSNRRAQCLSRFWATNCCFQGYKEVYPPCKEDCFCGWAWFYYGNLSGRSSDRVRGQAFSWLYCQFSSVIADGDESLLICKNFCHLLVSSLCLRNYKTTFSSIFCLVFVASGHHIQTRPN